MQSLLSYKCNNLYLYNVSKCSAHLFVAATFSLNLQPSSAWIVSLLFYILPSTHSLPNSKTFDYSFRNFHSISFPISNLYSFCSIFLYISNNTSPFLHYTSFSSYNMLTCSLHPSLFFHTSLHTHTHTFSTPDKSTHQQLPFLSHITILLILHCNPLTFQLNFI